MQKLHRKERPLQKLNIPTQCSRNITTSKMFKKIENKKHGVLLVGHKTKTKIGGF
jgi:hypothetical protein